eukprot:GDKJ01022592.1.p1 GENE.GDKJ01022592.1~~GDKJ01022592.1.p1  ORF type:complete len:177 (-),score=18.84 GDKJ01022592.1:256-711(-)
MKNKIWNPFLNLLSPAHAQLHERFVFFTFLLSFPLLILSVLITLPTFPDSRNLHLLLFHFFHENVTLPLIFTAFALFKRRTSSNVDAIIPIGFDDLRVSFFKSSLKYLTKNTTKNFGGFVVSPLLISTIQALRMKSSKWLISDEPFEKNDN